MFFAAAFKIAASFGLQVVEFVKKYWMQIAVLLIGIALIWAGYTWGFNSADAIWIKDNNSKVVALNKKIAALEKEALEGTAKAKETKEALEGRITELLTKAPPVVNHDASGKVLLCNGKNVSVFLGKEFKVNWNKLNEESAK